MKLDSVPQPASWANLVSSLVSAFCCVLMFVAYCQSPDFRTGSRRVATSLAIANFLLALSSLVGAVNLLVFSFLSPEVRSEDLACTAFGLVCQIQALVTWSSAISSFMWTVILSATLYLAVVKESIAFLTRRRVWVVFFISSVAVPLILFVPMLGTNNLGYSPFGYGGGCFIATSYEYTLTSASLVSVVKGLEVISYCVVIILFALIFIDTRPQHGLKDVSCDELSSMAGLYML